jgi:hypothetical protein
MRLLTAVESSAWLADHNICEDPYHNQAVENGRYFRGYFSRNHGPLSVAIRSLLFSGNDFSGGLLVLMNFNLLEDYQYRLLNNVRHEDYSRDSLTEKPASLYEKDDRDGAIGQCVLSQIFNATAYFYSKANDFSFLFWKGEIFEIWCRNKELEKFFDDISAAYGKSQTP